MAENGKKWQKMAKNSIVFGRFWQNLAKNGTVLAGSEGKSADLAEKMREAYLIARGESLVACLSSLVARDSLLVARISELGSCVLSLVSRRSSLGEREAEGGNKF